MSETRLPHPYAEDVRWTCAGCGHEGQHEPLDEPSACPACGCVYYEPMEPDDDEEWDPEA